ncbi:MAG: cyclopropane-fatty-acyl-phospholipid synthase [Lysobacterales bacterium]|jgi:cyclopropane-fatty-acyl-phospholipid synthase|nr:MAG: cyclopropane-fatty-acyl-phospholipid synthase [Xanthomonadales bacterium]
MSVQVLHRPEPWPIRLAESGWLPDWLLRLAIRRLCAGRLALERGSDGERDWRRFEERIRMLRQAPVALHPDAANRQHYEVPARFFELILGPRLKYSACLFPTGRESLAAAEEAMLELTCERAELSDGQQILELGCGWGSLTLWMAEKYPNARILAVSNSRSQRALIEARCRERGLGNVEVLTADVNALELPRERFDRCVSVEMFEHVRNYETLMGRIASWLKPGGKLFVHIFCHRRYHYPFEDERGDDWMARHFFTGGLMPAPETLLWFQNGLRIEDRWLLSGMHYRHTAEAWLANQDRHRSAVLKIFAELYGESIAHQWLQRWRLFWMACAELFGYRGGREWAVSHLRFGRPS